MSFWELAGDAWFNLVTWGVFGALSILSVLLLLYPSDRGARLRPWVLHQLRRLSRRSDVDWLDWRPLLVTGAVAFAAVSAYGLLNGLYGCHPSGVSDPIGVLNSGRAFWAGQDPFTVSDCGGTIQVPYGLAAVLIDAIGSLGGLPGIYAIWGAIGLSLLPLTWALGGGERRMVTLFVATSPLFAPLISTQIDGATNAIVPVTVLLSIYLARRSEGWAMIAGGFLSTARFPNVLAILGAAGKLSRRVLAVAAGVASFAVATAIAYAAWGPGFVGPVFLNQIGRRSFSLNLYGIFLLGNALPSSLLIEGVEGVLTLSLLVFAVIRGRSAIHSAAIVLVGFALLTPFLSFNILVWLLPVALMGARARWWLWGITVVGSINYDLALNLWFWGDGVAWPSAVLDAVLTVLLLALLVELARTGRDVPARPPAAATVGPAGRADRAASRSPP